MAQCTATFETGVNGATISTGDAGSATAFNAVTKTFTFGVAAYDNTHVANGTLAAKLGASGGTATSYLIWNAAGGLGGSLTDSYGRLYLYLTKWDFGGAQVPIIAYNLAGDRAARIDFNSTGKLLGYDNPAAALFPTFSTAITLNQWVRIEWHIIHSATVGQCEVKLFNTATSSTATETQISAANRNTKTAADEVAIGVQSGFVSGDFLWMDNLVVGATSYPGPFAEAPANTVAPVASGTATVGQTLSVTDGTWTGTPTPTFTYQWKRDGVSIGGQTAATHVIVSGDQGTTLTCTVTGTNTAGNASATSNGIAVAAAAAASGGTNPALIPYLYSHGRVSR